MDTTQSTTKKSSLRETELDNDSVLIEFCGYSGYTDFMMILEKFKQLIKPDIIDYAVDSLCIMGSFRKDGILASMSSEGISDYVALVYKRNTLTDEEIEKLKSWVQIVDSEL